MKSGGWFSPTYLIINLANIAIYMTAFYLLRHIQIPYLYNKKKIVGFILSLLLTSFSLYFIWRTLGIFWFDEMRNLKNTSYLSFLGYLGKAVQFYSPVMALLAWETHLDRQDEKGRILELEKEKAEAELKFLKAQLNPHFLFNVLNNLYSYVINQSPKAPDMILRLSEILDYVLYKSQKERVALKEEVDTIGNFIELEKIRYGDRLQVDFETSGNLQVSVSPLLLLSVVENAFKHGASGDIDSPKIKVNINSNANYIMCKVWNTKSAYIGELNDEYKKGIGLKNIRKQLNLIYPSKHDCIVKDEEKSFDVSLKIKLEE